MYQQCSGLPFIYGFYMKLRKSMIIFDLTLYLVLPIFTIEVTMK